MKKISLIGILFSLACASPAQFYVNFRTGYSISTQPTIQQNRVITDNKIDQFRIKFPYGNGLNLAFGIGYQISENFFGEINAVTTLFSRSHSDNNWEYYFKREYLKLHLTGLNGDVRIRNSSIQLAPVLGYSVKAGRLTPFIKAGLNILYMKSRYSNNYTYKYFDEITGSYLEYTELEKEYKGDIELGFRGSAGVYYQFSDKVKVSADLTAVNAMYHFHQPEIILFKVDGVDGEMEETREKRTVDFSNIGLNIGIMYEF